MPKSAAKTRKVKATKQMSKKNAAASVAKQSSMASALGSMGGTLGRAAGSMVGGAISRIFGGGAYTIGGNSLYTGGAPSFSASSESIRVRHREFVSDVSSSTAFSNSSWLINPGNSYLFPWLSTIAMSFETYQFHGLVCSYNPTSGTAISSTNPAQGTVVFSTNYDVLNPNFVSKQEAEAYTFTTSAVPYQPMIHPIECKPSQGLVSPKKYTTDVRNLIDLTSNDDPRLHFHGTFQSMTVGQQTSGATLGEFWVSYDIELFTPKKPQRMTSTVWAEFYSATQPVSGSTGATGQGIAFGTGVRRLGSGSFARPYQLTARSQEMYDLDPGSYLSVYVVGAMSGYSSRVGAITLTLAQTYDAACERSNAWLSPGDSQMLTTILETATSAGFATFDKPSYLFLATFEVPIGGGKLYPPVVGNAMIGGDAAQMLIVRLSDTDVLPVNRATLSLQSLLGEVNRLRSQLPMLKTLSKQDITCRDDPGQDSLPLSAPRLIRQTAYAAGAPAGSSTDVEEYVNLSKIKF